MVDLRAFALTTVAVVALSSAASAADLLPPPPVMEPPPPVVDMGGFYLRGDVGVGLNANPGFNSTAPVAAGGTDANYNPTLSDFAMFDAGVGYQFNHWFRADVTGELRGGSTFQDLEVCSNCNGAGSQNADFYRANLSSYIGMVNAYADLGTWYGLTPYVGAGVGVAYNRLSGATDTGTSYPTGAGGAAFPVGGYFNDQGGANLAWALMTGVSFDVTQNLKLELGYRYLNYGNFKSGGSHCLSGGGAGNAVFNCQTYSLAGHQLASSDFRIGLRYYLNAEAPPPPPPDVPLVRRY